MNIVGVPALTDTYENYIWVLHNDQNAWVIDPGESAQVIDYLQQNRLNLKAILITHKHHDHINGIGALLEAYPEATVFGPEKSTLDSIQVRCKENDRIELDSSLHFNVIETPGHTPDHIAYFNNELLFCGDTLFTGGCGRILGGTAQQFAESILKLRSLPDELAFYSAHEYTASNLAFARLVEPENQALIERIENTQIEYPKLHQGPQSTLGLEKQTNPFLRFDLPSIKPKLLERGAMDTAESLFLTLREWKDEFDRSH